MSRDRRGAGGRLSYAEPIIPMASKVQGDADGHDASAADGHDAVDAVPEKKAARCPLRGNAMKCCFVVCVVAIVVCAAVFLLRKWRKWQKKKAEDALLKSFILPEADRKFLEDAAARERKALQSAT